VADYIWDRRGTVLDALIHIPGSTCCSNEPVLFVMAFAHELRHFVQWATQSTAWATDQRLRKDPLRRGFENDSDFPADRDAIRFSKGVAVEIVGEGGVREYAKTELNKGSEEAKYWMLFDGISPSEDFDWVRETERLDSELSRRRGAVVG
jgi:hypothetical protein